MIFSERDLTKPIGFLCVLCTVLGFALGFVGFVVLPWLCGSADGASTVSGLSR